MQRATSKSNAATRDEEEEQTGMACSEGNSPPLRWTCKTTRDAGKIKSSTSSYIKESVYKLFIKNVLQSTMHSNIRKYNSNKF